MESVHRIRMDGGYIEVTYTGDGFATIKIHDSANSVAADIVLKGAHINMLASIISLYPHQGPEDTNE